ncbi:semaphorin-4D isoform 1-T7 [Discoglossus pictus]
MALISLCTLVCFVLGTAAFGPAPRVTWQNKEIPLTYFQVPGVFNYSTLLLSDDKDVLYIGAREVIFAVSSLNISQKQNEVYWTATEEKSNECVKKGKSKQTECLNYIRVLQPLKSNTLFVCGTNAFQPTCDHLDLNSFTLLNKAEDGKGRCPFDPAQSYTSVMVDGELYSGTSYTFLGSEPVIFKHSPQGLLRTEYAVPWLNEPRFVHSDVIRAPQNNPDGDDDKVYFFFTETSVEYEFFSKLLIPRIARVCKSDQGGLRTLQKKWTSYLKAKLSCDLLEKKLFFNIVNDVFILKSPDLIEPVIYGVFSSDMNNVGLSAVCAYKMSSVEDVFSKGKYMQSATVEQSNTKWVRFNGEVPKPRPGACINNEARAMNCTSSLNLPDKTLQFVKDHPLMDDKVSPIGNKPRLLHRNVLYTQIVVDRVKALDGNTYDVMFISTDKGMLHKAINHDNEMHIIEEIALFPHHQPVQTLVLSNKEGKRYIYAGSNSDVVQSPVSFCEKFTSCVDCVLTRDPYCAWHPGKASCVEILEESNRDGSLIQKLNGDASQCPDSADKGLPRNKVHNVKSGSMVVLKCSHKSNMASIIWNFNGHGLKIKLPKYHLQENALVIFNVTETDTGVYHCLSQEFVGNRKFSQHIFKHILELEKLPTALVSTVQPTMQTEGNSDTTQVLTITVAMSHDDDDDEMSTTQVVTTPVAVTNDVTSQILMTTTSDLETFSTVPDVQMGRALHLMQANDRSLLIGLFLLFFVLFCCLFTYNCYKGFLPETCLKYRSALLPGKKKTPSDFSDPEQGLKETLVENSSEKKHGSAPKPPLNSKDTGYDTEPDCGNGNIPHQEDSHKIEETEKDQPFDVKCELKYADSDGD